MRPSRIVWYSALTVVGGTILAKYVRPFGKIPGFSPNG